MFINGLRMKTKQLIDTTTGSSSNFTTTNGAKKIIETIAENEHLELYDRVVSKPEGVIDLKLEINKQVKIKEVIATKEEINLKAMNVSTQQVAEVHQVHKVACKICSGLHLKVQYLATP